MKIKTINLSLLILLGLVFLSYAFFVGAQDNSNTSNNVFLDSDQDDLTDEEEKVYGTDPKNSDSDSDGYSDGAEVKSGYDPTKPAPGDKVIATEENAASVLGEETSTENLTEQVALKISEMASSSNTDDQEVSLEEVQSLVENALNAQIAEEDLPEITKDDIKIKEQNYESLSEEKAIERKQEDFLNYIIAIYYILSSNSPEPITSMNDISALSNSLSSELLTAISTRDPESLSEMEKSGEKMLEQMKEVEVPEDLVDLHIKGLRFATYAMSLKDNLAPVSNDPLTDIANLSKIQGLVEALMSFSSDAQNKMEEYGLKYNATIQEMLESKGLFAPEPEE